MNCSSCGVAIEPNYRFCLSCGAAVDQTVEAETVVQPAVQPDAPAPDPYATTEFAAHPPPSNRRGLKIAIVLGSIGALLLVALMVFSFVIYPKQAASKAVDKTRAALLGLQGEADIGVGKADVNAKGNNFFSSLIGRGELSNLDVSIETVHTDSFSSGEGGSSDATIDDVLSGTREVLDALGSGGELTLSVDSVSADGDEVPINGTNLWIGGDSFVVNGSVPKYIVDDAVESGVYGENVSVTAADDHVDATYDVPCDYYYDEYCTPDTQSYSYTVRTTDGGSRLKIDGDDGSDRDMPVDDSGCMKISSVDFDSADSGNLQATVTGSLDQSDCKTLLNMQRLDLGGWPLENLVNLLY